MVNPRRRFLVVCRLGPENIRHKSLWVAIVKRKPRRLNLYHDPVALKENMICSGQLPAIEQRLIRSDWFRLLETLAIAASENVSRDHQLIPAHVWLPGDFIGI